MQVTYDGMFSVLIGDFDSNDSYDRSLFKDTWEDWHLIPATRPVINPPSVKNNAVEIPGMNGVIDMTEVLLGYPLYGNRSGSLDFYVDTTVSGWDFERAYDGILNAIHGQKKKVFLNSDTSVMETTTIRDPVPTQEDRDAIYEEVLTEANDPILHPEFIDDAAAKVAFITSKTMEILNKRFPFKKVVTHNNGQSFYYEGRLSVNSFQSDKLTSKIVINYDLEPFKKMIFSTTEDWAWNPFDFVDGIIPEQSWFYGVLPGGQETPWITLDPSIAGMYPQMPTVILSAAATGIADNISKENSGQTGLEVIYTDADGAVTTRFLDFWNYAADVTTVGKAVFMDPALVIGNPLRRTLRYRFINNLKTDQNVDVTSGYAFDFRPGRL